MPLPASPPARARRGAPPSRNRLKRPLRAGTAHVRRRAPARPPPSSPTAPQLTHRAPASAACVAGRAGGRSPVQKRKRKTPQKPSRKEKMAPAGASAKCSTDRDMVGFARSAFSRSGPRKREPIRSVFFFEGHLAARSRRLWLFRLGSRRLLPLGLGVPAAARRWHSARAPLRERGGGCAGEGAILPRVVAGRSARPLAGATGAGGGNASLHFFRVVPRRSRCALVRVARRRGAGRA